LKERTKERKNERKKERKKFVFKLKKHLQKVKTTNFTKHQSNLNSKEINPINFFFKSNY